VNIIKYELALLFTRDT